MIGYTKNQKNRTANSSTELVDKHKLDKGIRWTVNPGDRIASKSQTIEEKSKQFAVNAPDITGDYIKVPTYFIVKYPNGEKKALHHVRDAKKISDVIRQARFEEDWEQHTVGASQNLNLSGLIFIVALLMITAPILIGIF
ncbi:MAG: hypothetical protein JO235_22855 [Chroococcidiopsidaceae cyanobacterium CP_BM_RX_35]|nr:hypothetical protein [Chroococcidiopsidaceae cyanobacterium CP_BM_RX_35]